jgi:gluconolactonase
MAEHLDAWEPGFWEIVAPDAALEHIAAGFGLTEGPVWRGDDLLFSDIPRSRTVRWRMLPEGPEVTTFRANTGGGNGMALDHDGGIVVCEQAARRVTRVAPTGEVAVLADAYEGKRLNSPNDVVVHSSGAIYFTDPPFGLPNNEEGKDLSFNAVFRLDPDGALTPVATDCDKPNGLCFSPDERILYVADTPPMLVRAYDVRPDGTLANGRVFADMSSTDVGRPDGMRVDRAGNLYCTGGGGVRVVAPDGTKLGRIRTPEHGRNIVFGDEDFRTLYITAGSGLYRIRLIAQGFPLGKPAAP